MPIDPLLETDNYDEPRRAPKSEKRQRGAVVSVRFTPDELAAVEERAERAGVPISTFLRDTALTPPRQVVGFASSSSTAPSHNQIFIVTGAGSSQAAVHD
jgi:hypothetical protein